MKTFKQFNDESKRLKESSKIKKIMPPAAQYAKKFIRDHSELMERLSQ
jgi:hypothetical protein